MPYIGVGWPIFGGSVYPIPTMGGHTDANFVDKSYYFVTQFLDFPLWSNRIV